MSKSTPTGKFPAQSIVMLRQDEQSCLDHTRKRSALRQVRETEHLTVRQAHTPHQHERHSKARRQILFIDDERAFDGGDVFIED